MSAMLRITVEDLETGQTETREMPAGEYFVLTTSPCWVAGTQTYANGTHVLTVKGRLASGRDAEPLEPIEMVQP